MAYLSIGLTAVACVALVSGEPIPVHGRGLLKPRRSNHSDPPYPFSSSFSVSPIGTGSLGPLSTGTGLGPIGTGTGIVPSGTGTGSLEPIGTVSFPTGSAVGPVGSGSLLPIGTGTVSTPVTNSTTSFIPSYYSYSLFFPTGISRSTVPGPIGTNPGASGTGFPGPSSTSGAPYANSSTSTTATGTGSSFEPISTRTAPIGPTGTVSVTISSVNTAFDPTGVTSLPSGITSLPSGVTSIPSGFSTFLPLPTDTVVPLPSGISTTNGGVSLPTGYYYHHGGKGHHKHFNWWDILQWFESEIENEEEGVKEGDGGNGAGGYGYSKI